MLRNFPTDSGGIHRRHKPKFTLSPQLNEQLRPDFNRSACQLTTLRLQLSLSPWIFIDQLLQILLKINKIQSKDFLFFFLFLIEKKTWHMKHEAELERNLELPLSLPGSGQFLVSDIFMSVSMFCWCQVKISRKQQQLQRQMKLSKQTIRRWHLV